MGKKRAFKGYPFAPVKEPFQTKQPHAVLMNVLSSSFVEHGRELKQRAWHVLLSLGMSFATCFFFRQEILHKMMLPLLEQEGANRFIYTKLPEAFMIYLKISLVVACLLSLPVFLYHLGTFLLPGLYLFEAKRLGALVVGAVVLMWGGMVFCHQCLVPTAWEFFLSMGTQGEEGFQVAMEARVEDYIHLFLSILFAVSFAFQFPLILWVLLWTRVLQPETLTEHRRWIVLGSLSVSACLSPPDVWSQLLLGIPLILCFEVLAWLFLVKHHLQQGSQKN